MNLTEKLRFTTTFMENFVSSLWDIGIEQFFTEPPLFIGNNNNGYDYLIFFPCIYLFVYSLDDVLVHKETQKRTWLWNLAFLTSHLANNAYLLYGYFSKGLETNKFKNLIG